METGGEALGEAYAVAGALAGGTVEVDVTASLQAWPADPCWNHGWAFLPIGDDGWDSDSSEGKEPASLRAGGPQRRSLRTGWKGKCTPAGHREST